ncbi:hypothetical protein CHLRE_02g115650v5 [Chlamydomonas reinhardtii]|uniref:fructose-bisphosphate aldolase n=1 Tax=Chlamydomonas reinhardtii TaxID=3055 RepID=A0A2K3E3A0_CHLRE|nr:uncharacterized protein CHLRE_02g115650v5 [Chlamydomonas reinhardtii]PNW87266.1 hypothetical protein CHLRE_02g115650v5 [Chlamydomonas reinhardtii]
MSRDGSDAAGAAGPSRATVNKRGGKSDAAPREASRTPAAIFVAVLIGAAAIFAAYMIQNMEDTGNVRGPGKYAAAIPALRAVAAQLLHPEKGILAADESPTTFGARLAGHPNKPTLRQTWRRILLTTPGLATHISGVILHEETFAQTADLQAARAAGVLLGIKLDNGTAPMGPKQAGELHTRGLGGLAGRCTTFHTKHGASFAKWRAVFRAGAHTPSKAAIRRNSKDLASYAAAAQKCGLVPIIEPEVLADGDHDLSRAANASARVLRGVFRALKKRGDVDVGAVLLKVAMVTPGSSSVMAATPEQVG